MIAPRATAAVAWKAPSYRVWGLTLTLRGAQGHHPRNRTVVRYQPNDDQHRADEQQRRDQMEAVRRKQELELEMQQKKEAGAGEVDQGGPHPAAPEAARRSAQHARYSPNATRAPWFTPAFTRRREVFAGRLAMLGFTAACIWEWLLPGHPNILIQGAAGAGLLGIPLIETHVTSLLTLLILHNAVAALAPGSPTWTLENQADVGRRPEGPPSTFVNPLDVQRFWGITGWSFSKANELFHGRLAMLGFLAALVNQFRLGGYFGPGPLAQLAGYLGTVPDQDFYAAVPAALLTWVVLATALTYVSGKPGSGELDIY